MSNFLFNCVSNCLSICFPICLSICFPICLSICLSSLLSLCLSTYLSICLISEPVLDRISASSVLFRNLPSLVQLATSVKAYVKANLHDVGTPVRIPMVDIYEILISC